MVFPRLLRRLLLAAILLALVGFAVWYLGRPEPLTVTIRTVATGTVEATVANTRAGTIKACRRARLAPPSGGQVSVLAVHEGDRVKQDQLLLELWNEDLRAQLLLAEREREASRSRSEEICLNGEMARREAERLRPLRSRGLISVEQLDQAETQAQARAAACRASQASVRVNEAQVSAAQAALDRTILRAPFNGVVAEVTGELGEYVTPSPPGIPTPPAVDLIDYNCIYVSAPIDEVDAPAIRVGMPARITLDAFPNRVFPGQVRRIAPYVLEVEKQARTVEVEVVFTGSEQEKETLLPGYSADIEVILEARPEVLRIPSEALLEGDRVLVLDGAGTLQERAIRPGLSNWSYTQVEDGLAAGERVVVSVDRPGVKAGVQATADDESSPD